MAIAAGDTVMATAALSSFHVGQLAPISGGGGLPLTGRCVSQGSGNCVVLWENGTVVAYADAGVNGLTKLANVSTDAQDFYHKRVRITNAANVPGNPNGQGTSEGLVIGTFTISGTPNVDYAAVLFSGGDVAVYATSILTVIGE
jgi:hypothetical protein